MSKPPHLVLLMGDQLRRDVLGAYGAGHGATPRLDAFGRDSLRFDAHRTNCPLCVPARNSIATGAWPHVHGAIVNAWHEAEQPWGTARLGTYYERLAEAGYRVEHLGTNHLRCEPPLADRHERIRITAGGDDYRSYLDAHGLEVPPDPRFRSPVVDYAAGRPYVTHYTNPNTGVWPHAAEHFLDLWQADRMVELIERADPAEPLALMGMFWAPHCPLRAPEPYFSRFDPERIELPPNVGVWTEGHSPMHQYHLTGHLAATLTIEQWRQAWSTYLGLVRLLDEAVGRVIDALRRCGFWDDAAVLFTCDHGEMLGVHRLWQKMCMYEDAIRVPLFIKPPGGGTPGSRSQLTEHIDLAATLCDYAGVEPPAGSVGASLRPMVEDAAAPGREAAFIEFNGNSGRSYQQRCVVTPTHKFIYNHGWDFECYDLAADPRETNNLCGDGAMPAEAAELRERLARWMRDTNDCIEMTEA